MNKSPKRNAALSLIAGVHSSMLDAQGVARPVSNKLQQTGHALNSMRLYKSLPATQALSPK